MAKIVCGQQLSVASARAIWARFEAHRGRARSAGLSLTLDEALSAPPAFPPANTAPCGSSPRRWSPASSISPMSKPCPPRQAVTYLTAHKGIGPWTAEVYLMFCAGHPDMFPAGDLALHKAVHHGLGLDERPTIKQLIEHRRAVVAASGRGGAAVLALFRGDARQGRNCAVTPTLSGPMLAPKSGGAPKQIVVLLHGYRLGRRRSDRARRPIGRSCCPMRCSCRPMRPSRARGNPFGYQWFALDYETDRVANRQHGPAAGAAGAGQFPRTICGRRPGLRPRTRSWPASARAR